MSALSDQLTAGVATLTASVAAHDVAVQAALQNLANQAGQGDSVPASAVQEAIASIGAANARLQAETVSLNAAMPAPVQQASAAATQDAAPDSAVGNTIQTQAAAAADAAQGT